MTPQLKNRLVGLIILVALVVIFLPSIIDGKKTSYQQEFVSTPITPELKQHSNDFPEQIELHSQDLVVENEPAPEVESKVVVIDKQQDKPVEWKVETVAPAVDVKPVPTPKPKSVKKPVVTKQNPAWTIQMGAFKNKANINALIKNLNKAGYSVHTTPKLVIDGQLTRVFVGPDVSKANLEAKLSRLKALTQLNGKVVPFDPSKH
ncbi:SPOR domain-containing protein [Psychromonas aquatilis]|uniref:SPOR domain-containing protein n=1 Tax=Psychromonas aquatilis TaxID=2005072 RepID=A0ABU9GMS2_9GAMM